MALVCPSFWQAEAKCQRSSLVAILALEESSPHLSSRMMGRLTNTMSAEDKLFGLLDIVTPHAVIKADPDKIEKVIQRMWKEPDR